eukprot:118973-Amphidinium_carterae.1
MVEGKTISCSIMSDWDPESLVFVSNLEGCHNTVLSTRILCWVIPSFVASWGLSLMAWSSATLTSLLLPDPQPTGWNLRPMPLTQAIWSG